ncbi:hypothetical protein [Rhizobium sp. Leaf383]|uniref:hypothetical protein n=1 Tax=Rhizobium sp. Leaf383 TaxID=1736357 RepID=UPI000713C062|nr:hypothetical protein [Rhizobium sp. Leaf383]KQS86945.1 hypothetical protein ASG58_01475 [Rhizobium sp. Leaf383]
MTNVKMVALDTVHITSVSNDNLTAGVEFETDSATATDLEARGIAKRVGVADGDEIALRSDGPTISEYVSAGYSPVNYPPSGYASRSTPEEISAAIASADANSSKAEAMLENKMDSEPLNKSEPAAEALADVPVSAGTIASTSRRAKS